MSITEISNKKTRVDWQETKAKIDLIVSEAIDKPVAVLRENATFDELEIDSLDLVTIGFEIEQAFDTDLSQDLFEEMSRYGEVRSAIVDHLVQKAES